jgi:hypothetical protein
VSLLDDWYVEHDYVEEVDDDRAAELLDELREAEQYDADVSAFGQDAEPEQDAERVEDDSPPLPPVDPTRVSLFLGEMCALQVTEQPLREQTAHYARWNNELEPLQRQERERSQQPEALKVVPHPRLRRPRNRRRGAGRPAARRSGGTSSRGSPSDDDGPSDPEPVTGIHSRRRAGCAR